MTVYSELAAGVQEAAARGGEAREGGARPQRPHRRTAAAHQRSQGQNICALLDQGADCLPGQCDAQLHPGACSQPDSSPECTNRLDCGFSTLQSFRTSELDGCTASDRLASPTFGSMRIATCRPQKGPTRSAQSSRCRCNGIRVVNTCMETELCLASDSHQVLVTGNT